MASKSSTFDKATKRLVIQAMNYNVHSIGDFTLPETVLLLRETIKKQPVFKKVFGYNRKITNVPASTDYCKIISNYIKEKTGSLQPDDDYNLWTLMEIPEYIQRTLEIPDHWWLVYNQTGEIFDVTYDQFPYEFPYQYGQPVMRLKKDEEFKDILMAHAQILAKEAGLR